MSFLIFPVDERRSEGMVETGIWDKDCPVDYSGLSVVKVDHLGFDGNTHLGELIVLNDLAEQVLSIFKELLNQKFPIDKIRPMEAYLGDDEASMKDNNSSAYNGRRIMNTDRWSSHAYGAAIDINPAQNPYLRLNEEESSVEVYPKSAIRYINRNILKKGMVETVVEVFADHGFTVWGGKWEDRPDYHHFQLPWDEIKKLV